MKLHQFSCLSVASVLTLALSLTLTASTVAQQRGDTPGNGAPFTGIVAFGDSLSDTGNLFALTGGFPPPPYFEGRVSNGPIWIEYLANAMGLDSKSVVNYAFAGSTTGRDNENDGLDFNDMVFEDLPGVQDQLDFFEADLNGKKADKRALYIVWAGANDFFVYGPSLPTVTNGVGNTVIAVQRLYQAGARRIMVVNLPDLGLTPFGRLVDPFGLLLSPLSTLYNASLDSALDELEAGGIETIRIDSAAVLKDIINNPDDFGFSNVVDPFLPIGFLNGDDPSEFLFWDFVHPTTHGHFFIASEAMRVLQQKFRHVWGTPRNRR